MGGIVRVFGWAWLIVGFMALAVWLMGASGLYLPIPDQMAIHMARPWSMLLVYLGIVGHAASLVVAIGIVINATVFMVIANVLDR
jgi:hypothetical protein